LAVREDFTADTLHADLIAGVTDSLKVSMRPLILRGWLSIMSRPEGAELMITTSGEDETVYTGPAPVTDLYLQTGTYTVHAELEDHHPKERTFTVNADAATNETISLTRIRRPPPVLPPEPEPEVTGTPSPPSNGYICLASSSVVVAILDGTEKWRGPGRVVLPVTSAQAHNLVLHEPDTFSQFRETVAVSAGDTATFSDDLFTYGTLLVGANTEFGLAIDGVYLEGVDRRHRIRLGVGEHRLHITCPGFTVESVERVQEDGDTLPLTEAGGSNTFHIDVDEGETFWVNAKLRRIG
jgi:hypothetical protein